MRKKWRRRRRILFCSVNPAKWKITHELGGAHCESCLSALSQQSEVKTRVLKIVIGDSLAPRLGTPPRRYFLS